MGDWGMAGDLTCHREHSLMDGMQYTFSRIFLLFSLSLFVSPLWARVIRVEVVSHQNVLGDQWFGLAGPYEKLVGKVYFAVDPANPSNQIITDIDKAPQNIKGEVEFSADFYLLKPKSIQRSNGSILFEVGNRGRKGMLSFFNSASRSLDPHTEADFGDGFLLLHGYVLLWVGWQFDPPLGEGRMRLYPPVATEKDGPIRGLVRSDFVVREQTYHHSLADRNHVAYPVADPVSGENVMTVRDGVEDRRRIIPRTEWKFARFEGGKPVNDPTHVYLASGFLPGKIYEVVYTSQDPPLVGLGPAAIRDMVSHLKYDGAEALSIPKGSIDRALGFGISQSGRFLRTFLYYGFNQDETRRKVFDGVIVQVAGAGRGSFNHRFAQPSRDAHPYMNFFYPTDIFPFTDVQQRDPETGITDGLLSHASKQEFLPKVFYANSSYEYWGRAASLIHTTVDGKRDAPLMENVRIYHFAGTQHGPASFPPPRTIGQQLSNPMQFRWFMRALLSAMDRWVSNGSRPPASRYPRLDQGTLVKAEDLNFPKLPGLNFSTRLHKAYRADYGPRFRNEGVVTQQPPTIGKPFPVMVPAVDEDGNEKGGIKAPELTVPLATYTGWNLFNAESGPTHEISSMAGSYLPFHRTKEEREARGDPRPSVKERYESREQYLGLVSNAALLLIEQGYLLSEDLGQILRQARRHWDYQVEGISSF
ncbi:hypothetical protein MYX82_08800 [Acidobacteria bacterium AH-259-D05]|nr:hypothetical protein [Acidobacteria bacterium AH-259-D05]